MSPRTTAVLAVLLAILGGVFYFTEIRGGKKDPDAEKRLFPAQAEEVARIELRTPNAEIALRREGEAWRMERPLQTPGDMAAITELVNSLVAAKAERTLEQPPKDPADFGLDKPEIMLRFQMKGQETWRQLAVGGKSPTGAWAYVRVDEEPQVILVPETLRSQLNKTILDLRDKSVLDVQADKVTRLAVHRGEPVAELRKGDQRWELVKPVKARADDWRASELVRLVAGARAKEFAAEPAKDLKRYGLDRPAARLEVWEQGAKAPKVLALAEAKDRPQALYARDEAGMTVVVLDKALLTDLPASAWEMRDKSLFRYANKDVKRVRVAGREKVVAVEREGENRWKVVEPAAGPAEETKAIDLLFKLTGLRVDGVAAEAPDRLAPYGLDPPELTVTVTKTDGQELGTLLIGKEEGERRYVQIKGEAAVYTLPAKELNDLPRTPEDFRAAKPEKKA